MAAATPSAPTADAAATTPPELPQKQPEPPKSVMVKVDNTWLRVAPHRKGHTAFSADAFMAPDSFFGSPAAATGASATAGSAPELGEGLLGEGLGGALLDEELGGSFNDEVSEVEFLQTQGSGGLEDAFALFTEVRCVYIMRVWWGGGRFAASSLLVDHMHLLPSTCPITPPPPLHTHARTHCTLSHPLPTTAHPASPLLALCPPAQDEMLVYTSRLRRSSSLQDYEQQWAEACRIAEEMEAEKEAAADAARKATADAVAAKEALRHAAAAAGAAAEVEVQALRQVGWACGQAARGCGQAAAWAACMGCKVAQAWGLAAASGALLMGALTATWSGCMG